MEIVYTAVSLPGLEILSCANDRQFTPHLHDGYVLWLNSSAGEHYHIRNAADILLPGSISIIEPGVIHDNRPCVSDRRHLRSFYFSEDFLETVMARTEGRTAKPVLPTTVITDRLLWRDTTLMHEVLFHSDSAIQEEEAIIGLFARILKRCDCSLVPGGAVLDNRRVAAAIDYFVANLDRQFSLTEVALQVGCTAFHLIRTFHAAKGVSPHSYLMQLRLEHAGKLLASGTAIVVAALQSGFADQSHLTRQFKARFGITPGLYRKQRKEK